jgi:D-amino-acid dehydrogenase
MSEHQDLIEAAHAQSLIRKDGWMEIYRSNEKRDAEFAEAERLQREFGVTHEALSSADVARIEPDLNLGTFSGALRWRDPWSVLDPHGADQRLSRLFRKSRRQSRDGRRIDSSARRAAAGGS